MIVLLLIVLGLCLGSFVNAFVWRLHKGKDWVKGRSECPKCHQELTPWDLVPVLSWLWLQGRCRYCHKKIEDSPLVELALPVLFVISYLAWPEALQRSEVAAFGLWLILLTGFVALAVYDLRWLLLPDKVVYPIAGLAIIQVLVTTFYHQDWRLLLAAALGALVVSGIFYILFQVSKGTWIGGGDVKLGIALGLLSGGILESFLLLFIASMAGLLAAVPLLMQGKAHRKTQMPFGPFLIFALIIVKLFGVDMIDWYSGMLYG